MALGFLRGTIQGFLRLLRGVTERVRDNANLGSLAGKKLQIPIAKLRGLLAGRGKLLLFCGAGAGGALILCITVILTLGGRDGERRNEPAIAGFYEIPPEELFLPDEPDFLPSLLLERERRDSWTPEDVAPFWTDPLIEGREPYERIVNRVLDGIMERAP
ncbi:MAG: hypothetical protein LBQ35_02890 [Spirochaetaceae bacterium]|jgi:hypothetical protein|nr:hypothetical protein [Spirochaetaceae bacterium]